MQMHFCKNNIKDLQIKSFAVSVALEKYNKIFKFSLIIPSNKICKKKAA